MNNSFFEFSLNMVNNHVLQILSTKLKHFFAPSPPEGSGITKS